MGWLDDPEVKPTAAVAAPAAPAGWWEKDPVLPTATPAREAQGTVESIQAGLQGSAIGLAVRGRLPDLVMNPQSAAWWERLAAGVAGVAADMPIMIPAGAGGAAGGTATAGPVGGILAGGAAMFAAPAGIRTSLTEFYKARGGETPIDWFNVVRETAKSMLHEGAVGAVTFGAGAVARGGAAALMGASGQAATAIGIGTATMATKGASKIAGTADVAAQIAAMVTMPAAMEGRLPESREFLDAAAVILTLKGAHVALNNAGMLKTTAQRVMGVYEKTGKTPAEQVADAQADPKVAEDLAKPTERPDTPVPPLDGQLSKQEELWSIQDRLGELQARAGEPAKPLTEAETAERADLQAKAAVLEAEGVKPEPIAPRGTSETPAPPRYAPEEIAKAEETARTRLEALTSKADTEPLTDTERAERIGLVNAMGNPEALAKRFGIQPLPARRGPTAAEHEASAQKVHDEVLRQAKEAEASRVANGQAPNGDQYVQDVAALVRARISARAARLGVLPEDLYNEKPLQIRDETQREVAAEIAAAPPDLPTFKPPEAPEVDMFGDPVNPPVALRHSTEGKPIENVKVADLTLSKEVPQFKHDADAKGVVEPLGGEPDPTGWAIQVWERLNGALEVISGRHRWELWQRHGLENIPAQLHKESEGFTAKDAAMLDAELNIRDQQGSVADYVQYFKDRGYTRQQADERGLLARSKGQMAFAIARDGTPALIAANRAYRSASGTGLSPEAAFAISQAAPGSERLQNFGIAVVNDGKSALYAVNMMKAMDYIASEAMAAGKQGDLWSIDDAGQREAAAMSKKAVARQRAISEQISAVSGASKRPELARKMGVDVQDPEGIQKKIAELKQEQYQWDNWPLYPELVAKLRAADTLKQSRFDVDDPRDGARLIDTDKPFWSGSVDLRDHMINEVHTYQEADAAGMHHSMYFSPAEVERMRQSESTFFWIEPNGKVNVNWVDTYPPEKQRAIVADIERQIHKKGTLYQDQFELKPETPAELKARDEEAVAAAKRKLAQERAGVKGPVPTVDQADLFNTQRTLFQNKPAQERGSEHLASYSIAENLITTFRNANKSSIVHELSHSWLEEMKADAARPDAPAQIKADWEIIRREFAIPASGEISTASHEQFARTGERYLGEGVAPSVGLRGVFERFKAWMLEIYGNLRNLNVEINPEVRGMFDRLLATDQEIADAKALDVPRAYVPEARAAEAAKIVPPPESRKGPTPGFKDEQLAIEPFAEELLTGTGSGYTNDSRVNAQYVDGPMQLKLAIQRVAEIDQQNIQNKRGGEGGVRSWESANADADKVAMDALGIGPDAMGRMFTTESTIPHSILQRAAYKTMISIAKYSLQMRDTVLKKGDNATVQDQYDYLYSIMRMRMAQAELQGLSAETGRAMNQMKDMRQASASIDQMVEQIMPPARELFQTARTEAEQAADLKAKLDEIMRTHFGGKTALDIAKLQKDVKSLKGNLILAKAVTDATKWEMVVEGWKAGLLSGPQTPVTNLFGTAAFDFMRPAVDALATIIGVARGASPGTGETDRATMSSSVARLTGMIGGIKEGAILGYHAINVDTPTGKTESYREAIPGKVGHWIRFPYRLMSAGDIMVQTMYKRGELASQAILKSFDDGLNPNTREFAESVQKYKDHPTPEMEQEADAAAARMAFNSPGGEKMRATQAFVKNWKMEWMVPFIRTPLNIAEEMLRMSPFAPSMASWRADIAKGGIARDRAIAELTLGSGIMALTAAYAFSGQISGSGSPDPGKNRGKVGVWQPNSVLIGDTWYEIGRIQPVGTLMVLAADMATAWDMMNDEERDKIPKMLALAFSNAITNQTFLQGITNVVHMMSEPDRYGSRFFTGMAQSLVPNIIGQPTAMSDPYVRQVNNMLEAVQSRIPGMRQDLTPKRDWLGEPVPTKERLGVVMPVREQKISDDKVRLEAARLDLSMADAPKKTHIGKGTGKMGDVDLTPEERNKFAQVGGEMAHKILANIVSQPGYDSIPDLVKRKIFSKVLQASHQMAAVQAMPMEKRIQYMQSISEKVASELAPESQ